MYVELIKLALGEEHLEVPLKVIDEKLIPSIKDAIDLVVPSEYPDRDSLIDNTEDRVIELTASIGSNYTTLSEHAITTLDQLKDMDFKIILLSNSHSSFINKTLETFKLQQYFDLVITLDSGFDSKDESLKHLASSENVEIQDIIYIGDTKNDVELTKRVGCKIIVVFDSISWDYPDRKKIEHLNPDYILDQLSDLIDVLKRMNK
jgi:phosphoglycolate phosphatase-like HAD superfamily hydrolase